MCANCVFLVEIEASVSTICSRDMDKDQGMAYMSVSLRLCGISFIVIGRNIYNSYASDVYILPLTI